MGREMTMGEDMECLVKNGEDPKSRFDKKYMPTSLSSEDEQNDMKVKIQLERIKRYMDKEDKLKAALNKLYSTIWGQCSDQLQAALKYLNDFESKNDDKDIAWLLTELKRETAGIDAMGNKHVNYIKALRATLNLRQGNDESDEKYLKRMNASVEVLKLAGGGHVLASPDLIDMSGLTPTKQEESIESEKFLGALLLLNANPSRYASLNKELVHSAQLGIDNYPKSSSSTYELLCRRSGRYDTHGGGRGGHGSRYSDRSSSGGRHGGSRYGRSYEFFQQPSTSFPDGVTPVPGRDGTTIVAQCYRCQEWGHLANNCSSNTPRGRGNGGNEGQSGVGMMQVQMGLNFAHSENLIPKSWLLLDTCSTSSVTNNLDLVHAVRTCSKEEVLTVHTNGGTKSFSQLGHLRLLPLQVHYNPDSLANILCFDDVACIDGVYITIDTRSDHCFNVHYKDDVFTFKPCFEGLYYLDTSNLKSKCAVNNYSFLETVKGNKEYFTAQEIKGAENARLLQQQTGWPSTDNLKSYIKKQLLDNCRVTVDDVNRADIIFGPAEPTLEGKMIKKNPNGCKIKRVPLPLPILQHHKDLELFIDFFM
jgi:hypothetical protein